MNLDFSSKVVMITGAGSGIGHISAELFYQLGAKVVLVGRSDKVVKVQKEIDPTGSRTLSIMADLTVEDDVKNMVQKTIAHFGQIDVLVNSAGKSGGGKIDELSLEQWQDIHNSNGTQTFLCCKYVIAEMKKRKYGKVINVSSIAGRFRGMTSGLHYAYSKAGLIGFTRQLGAEVAPWNINVNVLCPSQTMTPMLQALINPEIEKELEKKIPMGRIAKPIEQANVIAFLASDMASYIAGAAIDVNGGQF